MSLRHATAKGAIWSGAASWSEAGITLLVIFALARLLQPEDFGIVAFAGIFALLVNSLIVSTFNQSIVQRENLETTHLDSSFWLAVAMASTAAIALVLASSPLGRIFGLPSLADVLPWMAMIAVIQALYVVQESTLMRELRFKPIAIRGLIASAAGGGAGIWMATQGYGVWSLVGQQLVRSLIGAIVIWSVSPWRPSFRFSAKHAVEIFHFGKYIMGNSLIRFVNTRSDSFVIGTFLGPGALGIYNVGHRVLNMMLTGGTGTVIRVIFSTFSKLQHDPDKLRTALRETLRYGGLAIVPLFAGVAVVSHEAVLVLLGEQWLGAVDVIRFLAVAAIFQFTSSLNVSVVVACGKASWQLYLSICFTALTVAAILVASPFGIVAVSAAVAVVAFIRLPTTFFIVRRVVPMRLGDYVGALTPAVVGCIVMTAGVLTARTVWGEELAPGFALGLYVLIGAASYTATVFAIAPRAAREAVHLARRALFQRVGAPA